MAKTAEIKSKIESIRSTKKITSAMEMVATSKMAKAKANMLRIRPYREKIGGIIARLANANAEFKHSFLQTKEEYTSIGIIIVSTDRGLCGGLNSNLFKKVLMFINDNPNANIKLSIIGKKAWDFFKAMGIDVVSKVENYGDNPGFNDIYSAILPMFNEFKEGNIDKVVIASNEFKSAISQTPRIEDLIPVESGSVENDELEGDYPWDYLYDPESEMVVNLLINKYTESVVYKAVIENISCEQSARMMAMKNATDSANDMMDDLTLVYNNVRQAAITQEISEIINGASAI